MSVAPSDEIIRPFLGQANGVLLWEYNESKACVSSQDRLLWETMKLSK